MFRARAASHLPMLRQVGVWAGAAQPRALLAANFLSPRSPPGDVCISARALELLVQPESLLSGKDHGRCALPGELSAGLKCGPDVDVPSLAQPVAQLPQYPRLAFEGSLQPSTSQGRSVG